ncbi:MAG: hypothetical protein KatS3mg085_395 [Candidatus Dojkabacteria bacterium]|nr:MAG: hypothetical protein KatS3mg085_395 [Candidatus Dojkabacteria bacterium]
MFLNLIKLKIKNQKLKKASSLVEVLIILSIISTTVIASTTIAVNSQKSLIRNEREEVVNASIIAGLEIVKSPTNVLVLGDPINPGSSKVYRLTKQTNPDRYVLEERSEELQNCTNNSPFQVSIDNLGQEVNFPLCLSVTITRQQGQESYLVTVKAVYQNASTQDTKTLIGYRNDEFTFI